MSAIISIIGVQMFAKIMNYYNFFKKLAMTIVFTAMRYTWSAVKFLFPRHLALSISVHQTLLLFALARLLLHAGSPVYYCKEHTIGCCETCKRYYSPYESLSTV